MQVPIYTFGLGLKNEELIAGEEAETLGGKGAGLIWMDAHGIPVPPGFIIPTEVWYTYSTEPDKAMSAIRTDVVAYLDKLKEHFGYMPLLSVRSGARVSCPGMMDTILNVGMDHTNRAEWAARIGESGATNSLQRLIQMYGSTVRSIDKSRFFDKDGDTTRYKSVDQCYDVFTQTTGEKFPDAYEQVIGAIEAVFNSWDNDRAEIYRKMNNIPRSWGTAVTVQAMVFGNLNKHSCTGVLFTRNPDTGANEITGEFLEEAQGEDVVAGIRTPVSLSKLAKWDANVDKQLRKTVKDLEMQKRDVQDVEFTVQDGKLYLLQTRNAKRSAKAAVVIALDMVQEGLINPITAVKRITPEQFDLAQLKVIDPKFKAAPGLTGLSACSGVVSGVPVFSAKAAIESKVPCILVTEETTPDDIGGMIAAVGVITMNGGATSHAAVVARGMNKPCITGVGAAISHFKKPVVSMDGATGKIWFAEVPVVGGSQTEHIRAFRRLVVEAYSAVPVITGIPSNEMERAMLTLGSNILKGKVLTLILECSKRVKHLYLDLSDHGDPVSGAFFGTFEGSIRTKLVTALEGMSLPNKVTLIGRKSKKLPSLASCSDLAELVLAEGEALLDASVSSDPATAKVLKWKKAEGFKFVSIGQYFEGMQCMLSVEQALQLSNK